MLLQQPEIRSLLSSCYSSSPPYARSSARKARIVVSNRSVQLNIGKVAPVYPILSTCCSSDCRVSISERFCRLTSFTGTGFRNSNLKKGRIKTFRFSTKGSKMSLVFAGMNFTCMVDSLGRYEIPDKDCLLTLFAKALGYAIITASTIVKLPQIIVIVKNNSIQGLSVPSFEMELVGYTIALSYCFIKQLPFSAFGELLFLLLQAIVLICLLYYYSPRRGPMLWVKAGIYSAVAPVLLGGKLDIKVYETLYAGQTALFTLSRIPQMWTNYSSRSTGQLSLATTFMNFAGCIARLFTSIQEKAPPSMVVGSVLGMICHGTLLGQILLYGPRFAKKVVKRVEKERNPELEKKVS